MRVGVVIVNYNARPSHGPCLDALARQTRPPDRVVVVDKASGDGSDSAAQRPGVELWRLPHNVGFAAANNRAVAALVDVDYVALLNPDACPEPDWLGTLLVHVDRYPHHVAVGSTLLEARRPGHLDGTGDVYHVSGKVWRRDHGQPVGAPLSAAPCFSPCAAAALYQRTAWCAVGGMDEALFCYLEDVDLGFRLRLAGYTLGHASKARVHHWSSACVGLGSDFQLYHGHRNLVWVYWQNLPAALLWRYVPQHLLLNLTSVAFFTLKGRGRVIWRAKLDALKGMGRVWRRRRLIHRRRHVNAKDLLPHLARGLWAPYGQRLERGLAPSPFEAS
ncbi:MAG: glycosyltransferase family 2 protein [Candidatus Competibacterales bacterium]